MRANDNKLEADDGSLIGTFSSHWAACAAMIRFSDPSFRSLGGDKPEDLAVEQAARERVARNCAHWKGGCCETCGVQWQGMQVSEAFKCPNFVPIW